MSYYVVRQGDHLDALAQRLRREPESIWKAPENEPLQTRRRDGNVLAPGDLLYVPPGGRPRPLPVHRGGTNSFRAHVPRAHVVLHLLENGQAIRHESYRFVALGTDLQGQTDGDGRITLVVPVETRHGRLEVPSRNLVYDLDIGSLDPLDVITGYQARLAQLGYYHGEVDGEHGPLTEHAVREFQRAEGLLETGAADEATQARVRERYGC